jgi:hypothetical protein
LKKAFRIDHPTCITFTGAPTELLSVSPEEAQHMVAGFGCEMSAMMAFSGRRICQSVDGGSLTSHFSARAAGVITPGCHVGSFCSCAEETRGEANCAYRERRRNPTYVFSS